MGPTIGVTTIIAILSFWHCIAKGLGFSEAFLAAFSWYVLLVLPVFLATMIDNADKKRENKV